MRLLGIGFWNVQWNRLFDTVPLSFENAARKNDYLCMKIGKLVRFPFLILDCGDHSLNELLQKYVIFLFRIQHQLNLRLQQTYALILFVLAVLEASDVVM